MAPGGSILANALGDAILIFSKVLQGKLFSMCFPTAAGDCILSIALGHGFFSFSPFLGIAFR